MEELPKFEEATQLLTPDEYRAHLAQVTLRQLNLERLEAHVDRLIATAASHWELDINIGVQIQGAGSTQPAFLVSFTVRGRVQEQREALQVKATYQVQLETTEVLPLPFYVIYHHFSGTAQLWPYLREVVHSITARMGIPQLMLPLFTAEMAADLSSRGERPAP